MHLLPHVYVTCDLCNGHRYNRETLDIRFKGKSISDVLEMTVDEAAEFFKCDIVAGVSLGEAIEDYPDYHAGPCCLVFQRDPAGNPIHTLWGLRKGTSEPAVLITCYRPDPSLWDETLRRRTT
jgi:hypothetical protein